MILAAVLQLVTYALDLDLISPCEAVDIVTNVDPVEGLSLWCAFAAACLMPWPRSEHYLGALGERGAA